MAAILRYGRGSQQLHLELCHDPGPGWRPSSGIAEDRNVLWQLNELTLARGGRPPGWPRIATGPTLARASPKPYWRSLSVAAEDRNYHEGLIPAPRKGWRPPSGVAGDRNNMDAENLFTHEMNLAAAVRGGRGSQLRTVLLLAAAGYRWRRPSAVAEDRNVNQTYVTTTAPLMAAAVHGGRGSRPRHPSWTRDYPSRVAALLRGGRGSQLPEQVGEGLTLV